MREFVFLLRELDMEIKTQAENDTELIFEISVSSQAHDLLDLLNTNFDRDQVRAIAFWKLKGKDFVCGWLSPNDYEVSCFAIYNNWRVVYE